IVRHRNSFFAFALALLLLACSSGAWAQEKLLTIDETYDRVNKVSFSSTSITRRWLNDGTHYLQTNPPQSGKPRILKVNALTGEAIPFFDAAKMEKAFAALADISAQDAKRLASQGTYQMNLAQTAVLINHANDLYYYEFGSDKAYRLTNNKDEEVGESFSPDGRVVSFVRGNNLYVLDLPMGHERALTNDGNAKVLNGRLDWIYQEEVYGRGNFEAYWWSPDSTRIAFLRLDETPVPTFAVVDHIPPQQVLEVTPYPKAGDPNPLVRLGMVD